MDVTEWLGSELYAYIPFDTNPDVATTLEELDRDLDGEGLRTQLIVALPSETKIRDGRDATLWFDPARMMVFDPESGENLTWDGDGRRGARPRERGRPQGLPRAGAGAREGARLTVRRARPSAAGWRPGARR